MIENAKIIGYDYPTEDYLEPEARRGSADYRYSRSDLLQIAQCPHKWVAGGEEKSSRSLDWGQLVDDILLYGGKNIAVQPATYENQKGETKPWHNGAQFCKNWNREHSDSIIVSQDKFTDALQAVETILQNETAYYLLEDSRKQAMVTGEIEIDGQRILLKCLIDIVPIKDNTHGRYLADLKTTKTAAIKPWTRSILNFGYHVQAALSLDMWNAATGEDRDMFAHVIQENAKPHETVVRALDGTWRSMGRDAYKNALSKVSRCLTANEWPGYDSRDAIHAVFADGMMMVSPEPWMVLD